MTVTDRSQTSRSAAADLLLTAVAADPWGDVSPAVYDTARLVTLIPELAGHTGRVDWLCHQQLPDGSWGAPDGYALVPTLSATEAMLTELRRPCSSVSTERVAAAARRGLAALRTWLHPGAAFTAPDTIAIEFLVPALIEDINAILADPPAALGDGHRSRLCCPPGLDPEPLLRLRAAVRAGRDLPPKLWASLEAFGPGAAQRAQASGGAIGASASATAAFVGQRPGADREAARFLAALQARCGGPVPGVTPITFFEQSWTLVSFATAGLGHTAPRAILDSLDAALGADGLPAAPGLPSDSDDTAAALYALALHGRVHRPDSLLGYRAEGYFRCFSFERNPSVSTNAHVLEALGSYASGRPLERRRYAPDLAAIVRWLFDVQAADGSWLDKWHASAYYATACCVLALAAFGGPGCAPAVERASRWVLGSQREDGSWGRWSGTIEETAYAVQVLAKAPVPGREAESAAALATGCAYLASGDEPSAYPGLWHAKDLYAPIRVVQAARLAALELGARQASRV
ncbi:MAG: hypothetical protein QOJ50_2522 [Cryptosporangiaceae bacterium]|nr:hypothetical protein [Cryptosporangiaceae bacterium]